MKTPANVVGRRLRRYLGALLAAGFGVTWWSFVPPVAAAVIRPAPAIAMARELVELHWSQTAMEPAPPPPIKRPKPHVHRPKPDTTPVFVIADPLLVPPLVTPTLDPIVVPDPQPEVVLEPVGDDFPPIRTRSSR
ncbi:MAG TPA: hypothetical protein VF403_13780 [Kofleriaceae bacterium]